LAGEDAEVVSGDARTGTDLANRGLTLAQHADDDSGLPLTAQATTPR
jgi:hypothetical protein